MSVHRFLLAVVELSPLGREVLEQKLLDLVYREEQPAFDAHDSTPVTSSLSPTR